MLLYEWGVATGPGPDGRCSPVGVASQQTIARTRMVDALLAVPCGVAARGWITVMGYVPARNGYQRFYTPARAERGPGGALRWVSGCADD
jgi:hypothetical protein